MRNLLTIVPARGGSKRVPGKNLRPLGGRSLIARAADFARAEDVLDGTILSTDDPAIAEEGRRVGLAVPFLRPAEIADDQASSFSVVLHALDWWRAEHGADPELTVLLQPTSPFRQPGLLREALALMEGDADLMSVVAMKRLHVPADFVFTEAGSGGLEALGRSGAAAYVPTGALYVTRTAALRAQQAIYARPLAPVLVSDIEAIDIDTEDDFGLAEAAIAAGLAD